MAFEERQVVCYGLAKPERPEDEALLRAAACGAGEVPPHFETLLATAVS